MKNTILIIILLINIHTQAQNNNISFGDGGYKSYNVITYDHTKNSMLDISYTHLFFKHYFINPKFSFTKRGKSEILTCENAYTTENSLNKVTNRYNYHFYDINLGYLVSIKRRHNLKLCIGPSLAHGTDEYLTYFMIISSGNDAFEIKTKQIKVGHLGAVIGGGYDYYIPKFKTNIGFEVLGRYYTNGFPNSVHYNLHIGYNF